MNFGMDILNQNMVIKLYYTDTDSFVIEVKTEDIYADISADVKNRMILLIMIKMIITSSNRNEQKSTRCI